MFAIVLANLADLCTFYLVVQIHPLSGESNPIVAPLYGVNPLLLVVWKAIGVALALAILVRLTGTKRRIAFGIALAVPLLGMASNTVAGALF